MAKNHLDYLSKTTVIPATPAIPAIPTIPVACVFAVLCIFFFLNASGCTETGVKDYTLPANPLHEESPNSPSSESFPSSPESSDAFGGENTSLEVVFCPREKCRETLTAALNTSRESIHCAFFELNLPEIISLLEKKSETQDVKLVVDSLHYDHVHNLSFARHDNRSALMHNKFCVIDQATLTTGSFNPTERGNFYNNNNLVVVSSSLLAQNYEDEFQELWSGTFGKGSATTNPGVSGKNQGEDITLASYFCPEDSCADVVQEHIRQANHSINFMTFSFTLGPLATDLIIRHRANVSVRGIMETRNADNRSVYNLLSYQGIEVMLDTNPYNMHH
ncbi:hypothetical protein COY95_01075, partial [Candidatus Woesearchaeota archaeon CG_4_10_14_0_8_um_filter_47_5]